MQISIQLAQINSPFHYTPWNVLALEALAGHVRGLFKEEVAVTIQRIRKEEELTTLLERIANNPPHILGISPELSSLEWTEKLLRHFYQIDFSTSHRPLVVLGNKLPSYSPGYFLKQFPKAIIVVGEGEESFAGLIEYTAGKRKLESIPNLAYIKDKSEYRTQVKTPLLETLIYPPSLDTVKELVKDEKNVLVQSSRGCSWSSCSYCTSNSFRNGKKWDGFIVERVAANIEQLVSAGITELEFADDDFFGGRDDYHLNRIRQIADEIERIRKKFDKEITFRIFVIPHIIYKKNQESKNNEVKQLLLRLKEVGLTKIYTGVESGCLSQLKRYNRSYTLEDMDHVINLLLDQLEIEIDIGFIMFDPYLTLAEMQQNLDYFSEKGLLEGNQWPFRPLAINDGAPLLSEMKSHPAKSKLLGKRNIDLMSYGYSFIEPNVQRIFTEIDQLSEQTREIFYALKQISKLHFAPWKQDEETRIAFELVKENGAIYLQLMKDLVRFYQDKNTDNCELFIIKAKKKIDELVLLCKKHIADRNIKTDAEDLTFKINHYLGEF